MENESEQKENREWVPNTTLKHSVNSYDPQGSLFMPKKQEAVTQGGKDTRKEKEK